MVPRDASVSPPWEPPPKRNSLYKRRTQWLGLRQGCSDASPILSYKNKAGQQDRQDRHTPYHTISQSKERSIADTLRTPKRARDGYRGPPRGGGRTQAPTKPQWGQFFLEKSQKESQSLPLFRRKDKSQGFLEGNDTLWGQKITAIFHLRHKIAIAEKSLHLVHSAGRHF